MDSEIEYSKHSEAELVEMFGRMDPRYAPEGCVRLGNRLTELGYRVTQGDTGPGFAAPSAAKLKELIGLTHPFECEVDFGKTSGPAGYLRLTRDDLGLVGRQKLETDGISVYLVTHRSRGARISDPTRPTGNGGDS